MASSKDQTMEYDKQMYKQTEKPKNHLAGRLNKFQENINRSKSPTRPAIHSIQKYFDQTFIFLSNKSFFLF